MTLLNIIEDLDTDEEIYIRKTSEGEDNPSIRTTPQVMIEVRCYGVISRAMVAGTSMAGTEQLLFSEGDIKRAIINAVNCNRQERHEREMFTNTQPTYDPSEYGVPCFDSIQDGFPDFSSFTSRYTTESDSVESQQEEEEEQEDESKIF